MHPSPLNPAAFREALRILRSISNTTHTPIDLDDLDRVYSCLSAGGTAIVRDCLNGEVVLELVGKSPVS